MRRLIIPVVLLLSLAACGESSESTVANRGPAEEITMPGDYSNVVTKCDHGNRIYVSDSGIAVVPADPSCAR